MTKQRKILKPEPLHPRAPVAAAANRPKNGCREHYVANIDSVILIDDNGTQQSVPLNMQVHYKDCKIRSDANLRVTLAKLEVINSEFWGFLIGNDSDSLPFLVVDPAEPDKIIGVATKQINNFLDFKNHPEASNWNDYEATEVASIAMTIAIAGDDDNHKENIGRINFLPPHVVIAKPHLRKIDHEYFFYDDIISRLGKGSRNFLHPFSGPRNHLDSEDIDYFPLTKNYRPHFWWPKPGILSKSKNYGESDKVAMERLSQNPSFQKAAYSQLYSFLLTPKSIFETMILQHVNREDPLFPLVLNTWIEQQASLRTAAMGSQKFRDHVSAYHLEYQQKFANLLQQYRNNVEQFSPGAFPDVDHAALNAEFVSIVNTHIAQGDTSLHAAIRSRQFRYEETMKWHGQSLHTKTIRIPHHTPLQLAIALGTEAAAASVAILPHDRETAKLEWDKVNYYQRVARYLVKQGAIIPDNLHTFLQQRIDPSLRDLLSLHDRLQEKLEQPDGNSISDEINILTLDEYKHLWADALADRQQSKVAIALTQSFHIERSTIHYTVLANGNTFATTLLDALELSLANLRDNTELTLKMKKDAAILAFKTVLPHLKTQGDFQRVIAILNKRNFNIYNNSQAAWKSFVAAVGYTVSHPLTKPLPKQLIIN